MEYLAKKSFSFLQDFAFTSIKSETYTNKWNILQKKSFSLLQDFAFTTTNKWNILQKKSFSFLQDFAFTSIKSETHTNKWHILQKSRFPFCKILHLLVLKVKHILINGISCKKVVFLFARFCIY